MTLRIDGNTGIPVWMHLSTEQEYPFPIDHDRIFIPGNLEHVGRCQ